MNKDHEDLRQKFITEILVPRMIEIGEQCNESDHDTGIFALDRRSATLEVRSEFEGFIPLVFKDDDELDEYIMDALASIRFGDDEDVE